MRWINYPELKTRQTIDNRTSQERLFQKFNFSWKLIILKKNPDYSAQKSFVLERNHVLYWNFYAEISNRSCTAKQYLTLSFCCQLEVSITLEKKRCPRLFCQLFQISGIQKMNWLLHAYETSWFLFLGMSQEIIKS